MSGTPCKALRALLVDNRYINALFNFNLFGLRISHFAPPTLKGTSRHCIIFHFLDSQDMRDTARRIGAHNLATISWPPQTLDTARQVCLNRATNTRRLALAGMYSLLHRVVIADCIIKRMLRLTSLQTVNDQIRRNRLTLHA